MAHASTAECLPETVAVARFFQLSLFLLLVTSFLALAGTGKLDYATVIFFSGVLLARGYLLARRRSALLPERWTTYLTLAYFAFYPIDVFLLPGENQFVSASVRLVLFSAAVKLFSVRRDRDYLYLALLALLQMLAASVLTVDALFLAALGVFVLLTVTTFISFEISRSAQLATVAARPSGLPPSVVQRSLIATGTSLTLIIAVLAIGIFFVLPRISGGYLGAFAPRNQLVTGFSDTVSLDGIGQIQQSSQVVMHIQIQSGQLDPAQARWRGVALTVFDGQKWSNPSLQRRILTPIFDRFELRSAWSEAMEEGAASPSAGRIHYRVLMEPVGTDVFFVAPEPVALVGKYREITIDMAGDLRNMDRERPVGSYEVTTNLASPDPETLRNATGSYPAQVALLYLQLPRIDPRIRGLAGQITASASNPYDQALAVEHYLKTHFGYTLQLPATVPRDPLANFLFERQQGHCEYFASSMTVMMRTLGIPARVVNGFRGAEYNDITGNYIIRARDAHSWVEVYFPGQGWVAFDPTPAGPDSGAAPLGRFGLYLDALSEFWREWIVNYDFLHQRTLGQSAVRQSRTAVSGATLWITRRYHALLRRARWAHGRALRNPAPWVASALLLLVLLAVLANIRRLYAFIRSRRIAARPSRSPQAAAAIWYERMAQSLSRRGWRKLPTQTSEEFLATIEDPALRPRVERFTRHYQRARFAASAADAELLPQLYTEIGEP